jgi:tyrosyl-tRNA synthetase
MSKSLGNYVGVSEPPVTMFGKLMSISDTLMERYYLLLLGEALPAGHPMDAKKQLAFRLVERYHSREGAQAALDDFNTRFSKRDLDKAELPEFAVQSNASDLLSVIVAGYGECFQLKKSRGDARRLVEQGSVQLNGEKLLDVKASLELKRGDVLRLDKTRAVRLA